MVVSLYRHCAFTRATPSVVRKSTTASGNTNRGAWSARKVRTEILARAAISIATRKREWFDFIDVVFSDGFVGNGRCALQIEPYAAKLPATMQMKGGARPPRAR